MLTSIEKVLFALAVLISLYYTWRGVSRIVKIIGRGQGKPDWSLVPKRLLGVVARIASFQPVLRFRLGPSLLHGLIGWGFIYFVLVNFADLLQAYIPGYRFLEGTGALGDVYRLLADLFGLGVVIGIVSMEIRRFILRPAVLTTRESTLLDPHARFSIRRDSAIVAAFIFIHVTSRILGESFYLAAGGIVDAWQPFATSLAGFWSGASSTALEIGQHVTFWTSLGAIVAFFPYFPYSKHIHLFFAPINYLLKPERRSIGELNYVDLDDQTIEQFGAHKLEHLGWEQLMDAYACIMCFRCQEVCPAYNTGKVLSPAALEVNKRYYFNMEGGKFASGAESKPLIEFAISEEAVWACTACGACVDICPVGNEPMRDILDIRRDLVLMQNTFPKQWENAFRGMERNANPWNVSQADRLKWAEGLNVPAIEQNPEPDVLWWVGCAPATDARAQKTAQAFANILNAAGVNFAVLGRNEQCTGDSARRAGREDVFFALAAANVEILNEVKPKRIVTTCPHCLHTLKNEYPAFGGNYDVVHHTQLINELVGAGKIQLAAGAGQLSVTYHDPCYLGRQNKIVDAPRADLKKAGLQVIEMPRHGVKSFCCGAGGAQMWKEEEHGTANVNRTRFAEAKATGAGQLAVGCPFCLTMLNDASNAEGGTVQVKDVAELVAERLK
jgi:Fe-S oxidoreductase